MAINASVSGKGKTGKKPTEEEMLEYNMFRARIMCGYCGKKGTSLPGAGRSRTMNKAKEKQKAKEGEKGVNQVKGVVGEVLKEKGKVLFKSLRLPFRVRTFLHHPP